MKKTKKDVEFYMDVVNENLIDKKLYISQENGLTSVRFRMTNEPIFTGNISGCYYFLLGLSRFLNA